VRRAHCDDVLTPSNGEMLRDPFQSLRPLYLSLKVKAEEKTTLNTPQDPPPYQTLELITWEVTKIQHDSVLVQHSHHAIGMGSTRQLAHDRLDAKLRV